MSPTEEQAIETTSSTGTSSTQQKPATLADYGQMLIALPGRYALYMNDHPIIGGVAGGVLIELVAFVFGAPEWALIIIPALTFGWVCILSIVFVGIGMAFVATDDRKK